MILINNSFASDKCPTWKSEWDSCQGKKDCIVISNPCGWPVSIVNKSFAKVAETCNIHAGAALSCATWDQSRGMMEVNCLKNKCSGTLVKK